VKVDATSVIDAARIANAAFLNGQNSDNGVVPGALLSDGEVWGNTTSRIRQTDLNVTEDW
jgi:hypothetical protein